MTAREAYIKLLSKHAMAQVAKCYEYDSVFVFQMAPLALKLSKLTSRMLDALISVDKTTGEVRDFKPFNISLEEYENGREVPQSVYEGW